MKNNQSDAHSHSHGSVDTPQLQTLSQRPRNWGWAIVAIGLTAITTGAMGHDNPTLSPVEVRAKAEDLEGIAAAASEGVVSSQRIESLPLLRPGETLELVPGLIVTQHAGDGKGNQYFLRGFNLDHGTDFATYVEGIPVNMPTHAHGQGYTDLNFLIPELVDQIAFRKGPYYASEGDFSSAGSARLTYVRSLQAPFAQITAGEGNYLRTLLAGSPHLGKGHLLYGLEIFKNDGPWVVDQDYEKLNGLIKYSQGTAFNGWSLTGMAYDGDWTSTDQVAQRAVDSGLINRFGSLDPTAGGDTYRYSLSGDWAKQINQALIKANAWWLKSSLDLFSNFQYCLNDFASNGNCNQGDQFKQQERRQALGGAVTTQIADNWLGYDVLNSVGVSYRRDHLDPVALFSTSRRMVTGTVRSDEVTQQSVSLWLQNETRWTPWFRSIQGLRGDYYDFDVQSSISVNSGQANDQILTPKLSLVFGPWASTEVFVNYGQGFHSNDARGSTITVDPTDPTQAADRVDPLVKTRGSEVGVRSTLIEGLSTTLTLWQLDLESELLFVGDAGNTEASRPSRRYGIEWTNFYQVNRWLALDADFSWARGRFDDNAPEGNRIPGAVARTANVGATLDSLGPWFGALRVRHIGERPLIEDNSVRSGSSTLTNLRVGYRFNKTTQIALDVYNLLDRDVNDIEYFYDSQLFTETAPVFDRHFHPAEPQTVRMTLKQSF